MSNISKISTFEALHQGLEKLQKPCSILVKSLFITCLIISVYYFNSKGLIIALIALIPSYFLGVLLKLLLLPNYVFWVLPRVENINEWLEKAIDCNIIWHPSSFLGRIALRSRYKEFELKYKQRVNEDIKIDKSIPFREFLIESFSSYTRQVSEINPTEKNITPVELYYSKSALNPIIYFFLIASFIIILFGGYIYLENNYYVLLLIGIVFLLIITLVWSVLSLFYNKNKGCQVKIDKLGISILVKKQMKFFSWEEIKYLYLDYRKVKKLGEKEPPFAELSYWYKKYSHHYELALVINHNRKTNIEYLNISLANLDKIISSFQNN